jgi:hypothetical protein
MSNYNDYKFATIEDILKLTEMKRNGSSYWNRWEHSHHAVSLREDHPFPQDLGKFLGITGSVKIEVFAVSTMPSTTYYHSVYNVVTRGYDQVYHKNQKDKLKTLPLLVMISYEQPRYSRKNANILCEQPFSSWAEVAHSTEFISPSEPRRQDESQLGESNFCVRVSHEGANFFLVMPFGIAEETFGLEVTPELKLKVSNGAECDMIGYQNALSRISGYDNNGDELIAKFDFTFDALKAVEWKLGMGKKNMTTFLKAIAKKGEMQPIEKLSGIKKTWDRLVPFLSELVLEHPSAVIACRSLAANSHRSVDGVKVSVIFNEVFKDAVDQKSLTEALKTFYGNKKSYYDGKSDIDDCVRNLDIFKEKRKVVLKSQANRAFAKIQEDAENLTLDRKKYKLTWEKIQSGDLPIGTFFRKSESYFLLNDNWDLWEAMFKRGFGEQAIALANEVKGRTTYEKDLMSYFYFVLHGLPEYLKRHTGHSWTCLPKLVNSPSELDPPKEGEDGISRQRSALTPIVDNDRRTVEVPYASLAIGGGFGTTYCYSHDYHVLTRGFSLNGYAITNEIEKNLNGRDDYGLMFYTLTGSAQGRGYPTFLIIFERRSQKGDTKVHFHRTHPFRSKEGEYNPLHQWIRGCFNWMAGNVNRELIKAQQGDLFFVKVEDDKLEFDHKVNQYDKHKFETEVAFAEYKKAAKTNILGYVKLEADKWLRHTEHDDVLIPAGTYAIHQCRSWEANPKGVWSLRID